MHNINIDPSEVHRTIKGIRINIRFEPMAIANMGLSIAVYAKVVDLKTIPDDKREQVKEGWKVFHQPNREQGLEAIIEIVEQGLDAIGLTGETDLSNDAL